MNNLSTSEDAIAKQKDLKLWSYLNDLVLPTRLEDCTVNLLIGVDIPGALGKEEGPFAVKTKVGWTLDSPLRKTEVAAAQYCMKIQTNDL